MLIIFRIMKISDIIVFLAERISNQGDKELPDDFIICYQYGDIRID